MINNKLYDTLKYVTQVVLPALGSFYFGLSAIWGLPAAEEVVGSLALLATFFGVTLQISKHQYDVSGEAYDGEMLVGTTPEGKRVVSLDLTRDAEELANRSRGHVAFKVVRPDPET